MIATMNRLGVSAGQRNAAGVMRKALLAAAMALAAASAARAQGLAQASTQVAPPHDVVSLSASATVELTMDWLAVTFGTTREGADAGAVQSQLRQALDAALAEARKAARPGELDVRTGGFSLYPRYAPKGGIAGWQGTTEMVVEGRDSAAIAQLTGRVQTMTIARVGWTLSREAREKVEGDVTAQSIARFRARADAVAREFGAAGWSLREVSVTGSEPPGEPVPRLRMQAMAAPAAAEALPVEAGKALVSATVSGSVQLRRGRE